jgi:hypothetical protein
MFIKYREVSMKRLLVVVTGLIMLQAMSVKETFAHARWHGGVTVSLGVFYDGLSPYGEWIPCGGGVYGWRPVGIHAGWRPYTVGRWCWTDDGWYWLSDEPWGWATFHYGRWHYDDYYGWIWIPGYDWAPAWVEWRYGGGCVGWAPLSPYAVFNVSWGIHYRTRWYTPVTWWNFVDCGYIAHHNVHRYVYRNEHNSRYVGNTRGGGSVRYDGGRIRSRGPEREYVEREGRTRIEQVGVREIGERRGERIRKEGGREHIEVYRPRIQERSDDATDAVSPGRVREERGRTLDLDTRKIDGRSRGSEREEVGEGRRSEEFSKGVLTDKQREESGRSGRERVDAAEPRDEFGKPSDEYRTRDAAGRSRENDGKVRERERVYQPEQPKEERNIEQPRWRNKEGRNGEVAPQPRPEPFERKREGAFERSQREEKRQPSPETRRVEERRREYSMPERHSDVGVSAPERRMETPKNESARSAGGGRTEGGRSRGR